MITYFEDENYIIPFNKVILISVNKTEEQIRVEIGDDAYYYYPIIQLENFKKWAKEIKNV
jgi:hypothetical protein